MREVFSSYGTNTSTTQQMDINPAVPDHSKENAKSQPTSTY